MPLKFEAAPICLVILTGWIAHQVHSAAQFETIKEVVTPTVFAVFPAGVLKESLGGNTLIGFGFIALGATFVFRG